MRALLRLPKPALRSLLPLRQSATAAAALAHPYLYDAPVVHAPPPLPAPSLSSHPPDVIVSVLGPDRVGLVHTFTSTLAHAEAHVTTSRMSLLGSDMAMIAHARLPTHSNPAHLQRHIRSKLPDCCVSVRETLVPSVRLVEEVWRIRVQAKDAVGIVAAIGGVVEKWGGNVLAMETGGGGGQFWLDGKLSGKRIDQLVDLVEAEVEHVFDAKVWLQFVAEGEGRAA
eukprot:GFKZ01012749.1.p1 GENE.GFKZ01012749.1~~GFKZ01012749.1.p1  ORF type:complete len:262 (-),score=33.93 GFKZ01012749.1:545-1222(-)